MWHNHRYNLDHVSNILDSLFRYFTKLSLILFAIRPLLDKILLLQCCRRREFLIHGFVNVSCDQEWNHVRVDRYERGVCNLAWLNTYARRSRGRQKANAVYSDPTLCLISSRICDEKSTGLSAPNRAINMQAFQTDSSLSRHKIQPGEKDLHKKLENGMTSNAII